MKKNITINLYGSLYDIDEDACKLLEQYLDNMRSYFSKREGGDEIADDIEHRVAELFSELKEQGTQAISISHVEDIIHRIGNPEEMDSEASGAPSEEGQPAPDTVQSDTPNANDASQAQTASEGKRKSWLGKRKLYRDPQDQLLGGVMSGICHYFGGTDPLPWRILMVLLALSSFSVMGIIYLLAWALIPAANTAEERLQMQGKPVNPETINEELMRRASQATDYVKSPSFRRSARSFASTMLSILVFCFKLLCIFIIGSLLLCLMAGAAIFIAGCVEQPNADNLAAFIHLSPMIVWWGWGGIISAFICLGILLYLCLRSLLKTESTKPISSGTALTLTIICLLSLALSGVCGAMAGVNFKNAKRQYKHATGTVNGVYIDPSSANDLSLEGWTIQQADNCNEDGSFISTTDDFTMSGQEEAYIHFDKDDESRDMHFYAEKHINLPEGRYRVDVLSSIDGKGVFLSIPGAEIKQAIAANGLGGQGNLATLDYNAVKSLGILPDTLTTSWWLLHQREEVEDWTLTRTQSFYHPGGQLTLAVYGSQGRGANEADLLLRVVPEAKATAADSLRSK